MECFSNSQIKIKLKFFILSIFFTFILSQQAFSQNESCLEEDKICNWIKKVVAIKTPTMVASGISSPIRVMDNGDAVSTPSSAGWSKPLVSIRSSRRTRDTPKSVLRS